MSIFDCTKCGKRYVTSVGFEKHKCITDIDIKVIIAERDRYKVERDEAIKNVNLYSTWMDGRKQCPPYGIPVLGYLQRSMDMEYELDIVHFELTERWVVSTTGEDVDVLFWHLLPEPPAINKIKEG